MEIVKRLFELIDANIICCLTPTIITLLAAKLIFKERFEPDHGLKTLGWIILIYTIVLIFYSFFTYIINGIPFMFAERLSGPYYMSFWLMIIGACLLPLTLFVKKLGQSYLFVFLVAFGMKMGFFFERFVILVTSIHRDYPNINHNPTLFDSSSLEYFAFTFSQGILIGVLLLTFFEVNKWLKRK